jgi:hypothetical protein
MDAQKLSHAHTLATAKAGEAQAVRLMQAVLAAAAALIPTRRGAPCDTPSSSPRWPPPAGRLRHPPQRTGGREDPGHQRLPRQPAAVGGRHPHQGPGRPHEDRHRAGRRRRAPGHRGAAAAREEPEPRLRRRGRPDRRHAAAVGAVQGRADDRVAGADGAGSQRGRQPRVRQGRGRTAAHAERRLRRPTAARARSRSRARSSSTWRPARSTRPARRCCRPTT